ncbi:uncharacterized protein PAC_06410 [Phialocephala subalpina]|uniref:Zn(2)-C6 fungal-type domain-containing protein n=1 Tax=Phialocephala subalpina TaxID=576137 RepID=A0A1L7WUT1_9HELO|nr:uncharacterized protein PAC_06410 [Phialocephala subalpina]
MLRRGISAINELDAVKKRERLAAEVAKILIVVSSAGEFVFEFEPADPFWRCDGHEGVRPGGSAAHQERSREEGQGQARKEVSTSVFGKQLDMAVQVIENFLTELEEARGKVKLAEPFSVQTATSDLDLNLSEIMAISAHDINNSIQTPHQPQTLNNIIKMRREALLVLDESPLAKGCITCKKRHLRCDERKPGCKRCINSGRTCEGYVCMSIARKPTDVTPESVLEFRQKCLPSREHPKKALVALPTIIAEEPRVLYSFATMASRGLAAPDDFMHHILRAMMTGHKGHRSEELTTSKRKEKEQRKMSLIRLHEPVKDIFDLSRPERCPVVRSAFVVQMYRIMMGIVMSRTQTSDKLVHGMVASVSKARSK